MQARYPDQMLALKSNIIAQANSVNFQPGAEEKVLQNINFNLKSTSKGSLERSYDS